MIVSRLRILSSGWIVAAFLALLAPFALSQSELKKGTATVEGRVCDSQHHPLADATVRLERTGDKNSIVAQTDSQGRYHFTSLSDGNYTLRAKLAGFRDESEGPLAVAPDHVTSMDFVLTANDALPSAKNTPHSVEYSDEPQFTVAGVTDPTNLGGHGSDTVMRTKESLAKEAVGLNRTAPGATKPSSTAGGGGGQPSGAAAAPAEGFTENLHAGNLLLEQGTPQRALPFLERASQLRPGDYDASYSLALACARTGDFSRAHQIVQTLLARQDRAGLHALLADISEREGHPVEAAREYERAAEMDPSEQNFFAWGAELLLHRAYVPASEVFAKGHRLFPKSARMLEGLGVASYDGGSLEQGVRQLIEACDLDPDDPNPYLFLGKIQDAERSEPPEMLERFKRFATLQPQNAMANYYYAVGLAKESAGFENFDQIESLLLKSVALDPHLGDAYLQLGIIYSLRKEFAKAESAYHKATENTPLPAEAHFRLAQVYRQTGRPDDAQREIKLYVEISKKRTDESERERHEIGQFVYTLRSQTTSAPSQNPH